MRSTYIFVYSILISDNLNNFIRCSTLSYKNKLALVTAFKIRKIPRIVYNFDIRMHSFQMC